MAAKKGKSRRRSKGSAKGKGSKARGKPSTRKGRGQKKTAASRAARDLLRKVPAPALPTPSTSLIPPERRADLAGVLLLTLAGLTLLALLMPQEGRLQGWAAWMRRGLGWGVYGFPLVWGGVGLWLVLRNQPRYPSPTPGRVLGVGLVWLLAQAMLHGLLGPPDAATAMTWAADGRGGGYVGAGLWAGLVAAFGSVGAWLVVLALGVWAVALALDRPVAALFGWVPSLWERVLDWWDERRLAAQRRRPALSISPPEAGQLGEGVALSPPAPETTPPSPGAERATMSQQPVWEVPDFRALLSEAPAAALDEALVAERAQLIEETLALFGAPGKVVEIQRGPTVTLFGVAPGYLEGRNGLTRVRVSKIAALADDLALALAAKRVRIQAPVPGKGYIGIEVPNEQPALVTLRQVMESEAFQRLRSPLRIALGQDVAGRSVAADLAAMPHLLIAGATGSGKSVCINGIITCLLLQNTPEDLRLLLVDPKRVELTGYNGIPHLLAPVVVELERVVGALQWVTREMERRYRLFAEVGSRHLDDYNRRMQAQGRAKLPYLVVVIDELADLMMLAPDATEKAVTRLAQLARATGIHLVIATQRPSVDVVTGLIKANFPARIAFAVASGVDSRVILDQPGAERLLGRGDMLFQAPDAPEPIRLQGVYVSDEEIRRVVAYWRRYVEAGMAEAPETSVVDAPPPGIPLQQKPLWEEMEAAARAEQRDPLWDQAIAVLREAGRASVSLLQRRLRIGYTRAARLIDALEEAGIVGPLHPTTGVREVLLARDEGSEEDMAEGKST